MSTLPLHVVLLSFIYIYEAINTLGAKVHRPWLAMEARWKGYQSRQGMDDQHFIRLMNGVLRREAPDPETSAAKTVWSRIQHFNRIPYAQALSIGIASANYHDPHPFFTVKEYGADGEGETAVTLCQTPAEFWGYVLQA